MRQQRTEAHRPQCNGVLDDNCLVTGWYQQPEAISSGSLGELNDAVQEIQKNATWWDLHGADWCIIASGFAMIPPGLWLLTSSAWAPFIAGMLLLGFFNGMLKKISHLTVHSSLSDSKWANRFWLLFFTEFLGSFSSEIGMDTHVKIHHPHTNIIGLGDSSTWRMPFLPRYVYLFIAPLTLPVLTPLIAFTTLLQQRKLFHLLRCFVIVSLGLVANVALLMTASGLTLGVAIATLVAYRGIMEIPYIHINIFQHIGLPMHAQENRPTRIRMMSSSCLNLISNPLLNWIFGHSLISCHIEHHLYPKLSDNMCLKIRPVVRQYLRDCGLSYREKSYSERLRLFMKEYESLMVNAPPITHFIGVQ